MGAKGEPLPRGDPKGWAQIVGPPRWATSGGPPIGRIGGPHRGGGVYSRHKGSHNTRGVCEPPREKYVGAPHDVGKTL